MNDGARGSLRRTATQWRNVVRRTGIPPSAIYAGAQAYRFAGVLVPARPGWSRYVAARAEQGLRR
ncbi:hypothetical protein Airi02_079630 [Actinoallomurus iriomotensis]|uniref:Uncharacterized protein n=1 Tax=Actinoallomurus iriomotensis TaxID=478107 RepID=A0A9W6S9W6_9ACTN|nr:hypothetical protein Airi02_079630 [Actinoallomurus iriomotensis]